MYHSVPESLTEKSKLQITWILFVFSHLLVQVASDGVIYFAKELQEKTLTSIFYIQKLWITTTTQHTLIAA